MPELTNVNTERTDPQRPVGILLPSEQKRSHKKRKSKRHTFRKSVGAFFNAFSAKGGKYSPDELAKEREKWRRNHPEEEDDYYVYYGDPQKDEQVTMTQNALNPELNGYRSPSCGQNGHRSPSNGLNGITAPIEREVEVLFEDATSVLVTADASIRANELISRALEKRGYSPSKAHSFMLCLKERHRNSVVILQDMDNPFASMAQNLDRMTAPQLVVCHKSTR